MAALTPIEQEVLDAYEALLWAVVAQAVDDATTVAFCRPATCPYERRCAYRRQQQQDWERGTGPDEAMHYLVRTFGSGHRLVHGVRAAIAQGRHVRVELHRNSPGNEERCDA